MKRITDYLLCVLMVFSSYGFVFSQIRKAEFKIHQRGNLWETMKDDGTIGAPDPFNRIDTYPSMDWPGGPSRMSKDDQRSYSVGSGVWIGGRYANGTLFFTENGPFSYVDPGTFEPITKTENFIGSAEYDVHEAEEIITARWTTTAQVACQRISRAWSFRGLHDFILIEYTFTNKNSTTLQDVYFGFPYLIRPSYQDFLVHNGWGDDLNRSDDFVTYDSTRRLLYSWDDTPSPEFSQDIGNWWAASNELRTPGYAGYALLYADAAQNQVNQPAHVFWAQLLQNEKFFSLTTSNATNLYNILSGADRSLQAASGQHLTPFMLMSCGPYVLDPNQSVRIVMVHAVNGLPLEVALQGLAAQSLLPAGLDSLRHTVDRAKTLFENEYRLEMIPPPSPAVDIIAIPARQSIKLVWSPVDQTWNNPLTGKNAIAEYRIYRGERSFIGPYSLLRNPRQQIKPGRDIDRERFFDAEINRWVYEDNTIALGVSYFYTITAYDSAGNESWFTNRNEQAIRAVNEPALDALHVRVFPNPFRKVSGFLTAGEENTIVWTNLPARCTIRIYTSSGELIRVLEHDNPNSGEAIWDQLTDARQRTAPGIYFWSVESQVGKAKGTLLIIK